MRHPRPTTGAKADGFRRLEVITGVGRRRRWSLEDKARIVAESLAPATTAAAVARRYGLHANQLVAWRQQLHRRAAAAETIDKPAFVPVLLAEDSTVPAEAAGRMEIVCGPAVVRVGADVGAAALRRVLLCASGGVRPAHPIWAVPHGASCGPRSALGRRSRLTAAQGRSSFAPASRAQLGNVGVYDSPFHDLRR